MQSGPKPISVEQISGNQLIGRLLALLANIRLGWEGMAETNALTYYEVSYITDIKFYNIGLKSINSSNFGLKCEK
jgi:hypothetical protein